MSVELDAARTQLARENLQRAELQVELRTEDARDTLAGSPASRWSFIFLDADRSAYPSYRPDLVRVLAPNALLAIDNVLSHADELEELEELTRLVEAEPRVTSAVVPVGAGVCLVVRDRRRVSG